jgi:hypothetical protein
MCRCPWKHNSITEECSFSRSWFGRVWCSAFKGFGSSLVPWLSCVHCNEAQESVGRAWHARVTSEGSYIGTVTAPKGTISVNPDFLSVAGCATTQEPPSIFWNPKVYYHIHKGSPLVPILSQKDPAHNTPSYLCKIHLNIICPRVPWSS